MYVGYTFGVKKRGAKNIQKRCAKKNIQKTTIPLRRNQISGNVTRRPARYSIFFLVFFINFLSRTSHTNFAHNTPALINSSRLDSSMPLIFWAGAGHLRWPCPLLKKYYWLLSFLISPICEGKSDWSRAFFQRSFLGRFSFLNPLFFFGFTYFPPCQNPAPYC